MSTVRPGSSASTMYVDPFDPLYPSSDGKPMAESTTQFRWIVTIKEGLDALFADRPDVFVAGDLLWYATKGDVKDVMAPDAMVVFGRPKGDRRSYREWVEEGVVPQVVFEVASYTNTPEEMAGKRKRYDARGVEEYYFYDPETGVFEGWLRRPDGLKRLRKASGWTSPRLGVTFDAPRRKEALVLIRPDGRPFRSFGDLVKDEETARRIAKAERRRRRRAEREAEAALLASERAGRLADTERLSREEAEARAEAESRRAEAESRRAEAESRRAELMAAKLRELGVEPE